MTNASARKIKTALRPCYRCGHPFEITKAQCTSCRAWNSLGGSPLRPAGSKLTITLSDVDDTEIERYSVGPLDYCFGGGLAKTSVNLLAGAPGAGKTTLALVISGTLPEHVPNGGPVLYVGAEQTVKEIKAYAKRIKLRNMNRIELLPMHALGEFQNAMSALKPIGAVLDSLSKFVSTPEEGVELCEMLKLFAIDYNCPFVVIDHITKEEDFAGLKKLEHTVDGTFMFSPIEKKSPIRIFETHKNRNGPAQISSLFEMTESGLKFLRNDCDKVEEEDE